MNAPDAVLRLDLPRTAEAAGAARKALSALNGSLHLVSEARLRDAQLLVTELVSNAVRHGGSSGEQLTLRVLSSREVMRVEVADGGPGFDPSAVEPPSHDRGGGWGLQIVASVAHRWGVVPGLQTTVWYEIDRPGRETPLAVRPAGPTLPPAPGG